MNTQEQWEILFNQKIKEVLNPSNKFYEYATLSPTASGSCARELIAEEYCKQKVELDQLKSQLNKGVLDSYSYTLGFSDGKQSKEHEIEQLKNLLFAEVHKRRHAEKSADEMLLEIEAYKDWMCSIHSFIDSTCPKGFVDEAFRAPINSILMQKALNRAYKK
jgi:hypothetical protein